MTRLPQEGQGAGGYPAAIAAAGPSACAAWDQLVNGAGYRPATRRSYRTTASRFLRWLEPRGVALEHVTPGMVEEYLSSLAVRDGSRGLYRTALRRLFDALAVRGVVPDNPADRAALRREPPPPCEGTPTREQLKGYVHELALDPVEEGDDDFDAALVMLAALSLGTGKVMPLSRLTGVPPRRVAAFARELRASGVWTADGKTSGQWLDEEGGELAFWLDVWVAQGLLERRPDEDAAAGGGGRAREG